MAQIMAHVTVTLNGERRVLASFNRLRGEAYAVTRREVRASLKRIRRNASMNAPELSGDLKKAIRFRTMNDGLRGSVRAAKRYALPVEFGTSKRLPRPFLFPAYDAEVPRFERNIQKGLGVEAPRRAAR